MGLYEVKRHKGGAGRSRSAGASILTVLALLTCQILPAGCAMRSVRDFFGGKISTTETIAIPPGNGVDAQGAIPATAGDSKSAAPKTVESGEAENRRDGSENTPGDKKESVKKPFPESIAPFPKTDHTKRYEQIRHTAIDLLNQAGRCDVAALCRDSVTEGWSLTLYVKSEKTFSMTVYDWNPIDSKWTKTFASKASPIRTLENHLRISSHGKECRLLKGNAP
jgi:hypothetical protein